MDVEEIFKVGEEKTEKMMEKLSEYKLGDLSTTKLGLQDWKGKEEAESILTKFANENPEVEEVKPESKKRHSWFVMPRKYNEYHFPSYQLCPTEFYELQEKEKSLFEKSETLSEEDKKRKDFLAAQTFSLTKTEFKQFITQFEMVGNDKEKIVSALSDIKRISEYYDTFFERIEEVQEGAKVKAAIKKYEQRVNQTDRIKEILSSCPDSMIENAFFNKANIYYNAVPLLRSYLKFIGDPQCFDKLRLELFENDKFAFDFYIKSRNISELAKIVTGLIGQMIRFYDKGF